MPRGTQTETRIQKELRKGNRSHAGRSALSPPASSPRARNLYRSAALCIRSRQRAAKHTPPRSEICHRAAAQRRGAAGRSRHLLWAPVPQSRAHPGRKKRLAAGFLMNGKRRTGKLGIRRESIAGTEREPREQQRTSAGAAESPGQRRAQEGRKISTQLCIGARRRPRQVGVKIRAAKERGIGSKEGKCEWMGWADGMDETGTGAVRDGRTCVHKAWCASTTGTRPGSCGLWLDARRGGGVRARESRRLVLGWSSLCPSSSSKGTSSRTGGGLISDGWMDDCGGEDKEKGEVPSSMTSAVCRSSDSDAAGLPGLPARRSRCAFPLRASFRCLTDFSACKPSAQPLDPRINSNLQFFVLPKIFHLRKL
ncbi:hypothetical protein DFH09DRAFT_1087913 [Mycena vulgaris]|nr:hypothetical protein DFH09DRAFT_1087913 [Mycena vulgaris]